jgi:hypothetical protein
MAGSRRRSFGVAAVLAGLLGLGLPAASATTRTTTLHFFQKNTSSTFLAPDGTPTQPPSATSPPAIGERFVVTDNNYVGNHKKHAKTFTATDHLVCTITSAAGTATCDGQIAIGGSMLLAQNVTVNLAGASNVVPINGGTGKYLHARGTATSVTVGDTENSDFTVKVSF